MVLEAYAVNIILKNYLHVKGYPVNQNPSHSSFCSKRKVRKWSSQWLSLERSFFFVMARHVSIV